MRLTFFGAARAVTGSCHCVECGGTKILIDCGLQQGRDEWNDNELTFHPSLIDSVVVTHAHIDHSGRLPLLVKQGFTGKIYCTRMTARLLGVMLLDSAHIQESDAAWENQKGKRAGKKPVEPLYTVADAQAAIELLCPYEYGQMIDIGPGIRLRFNDAGHLLGSSCPELWLTEQGETKKIVFSGDLGNVAQPIICDPQPIDSADYVVMESTYGDRLHTEGAVDNKNELAAIIERTFARGGNVIIPSFAVGRTQELLYSMREIKEEGLAPNFPDFTVCVDSPLANEATRIFSGDLRGYLDDAALAIFSKGSQLFTFPGLKLVETSDESKLLNEDKSPKVIISASGMCDAGRIRHHLKHNLWRSESTIVFVGYQAEGSLGRYILEGAESVKLFGEEIAVRAEIVSLKGMSSHADRDHLLEWARNFSPRPRHIFVVHGAAEVTELFAGTLCSEGFAAHAPNYEEVYDLAADTMLAPGIQLPTREKPRPAAMRGDTPSFRKLVSAGKALLEVIEHNRGGSNKDLGKLTNQILALISKWDR